MGLTRRHDALVSQLVLPLRLADHAIFASFLSAGNETLVDLLAGFADGADGPGCWLWGPAATGKTHLLQAACDRAGDRSVYVPLGELSAASPELLDGLASRDLVCLDDIDSVAGDAAWEAALFDLFNQIHDAEGHLVVAASMSPRECPVSMADLKSRLTRLPTFHVQPLDEASRVEALQLRAGHRGLDLPDDTARYLISRNRRDMASLYSLLDKLDLEALRAQRRLTIPFVREVLQAPD
jgi:DnaA family protein